ncbi:MAG: hypothetical protein RBR52_14485 [Thiomonas sp.]|uniref:hypothetical protein n=1 Tax=Thiomonas sp. TaxID=2047785 RepID=UPI002A35CAF2|nr:hypothetical protein [Thiomonas sp.]MDY0331682.1 hypothetical protein [Thiomonas sp.]
MLRKIRFLLTRHCTATCAYCHNEGQSGTGASLLRLEQVESILDRFDQSGLRADVHSGINFVTEAHRRGLDSKIIDLFGGDFAPCIRWQHQGYTLQAEGVWLHAEGMHRLYTKTCTREHNLRDQTYFIGAEGVRLALDAPIIAALDDFHPLESNTASNRAEKRQACQAGTPSESPAT